MGFVSREANDLAFLRGRIEVQEMLRLRRVPIVELLKAIDAQRSSSILMLVER